MLQYPADVSIQDSCTSVAEFVSQNTLRDRRTRGLADFGCQSIQKNLREGKAKDDQNKIRQAKSRQKKLDDRWGIEMSARGGRFKLNRDLAGYHLTSRAEIETPQDERPVQFVLPESPDLRFPGALIVSHDSSCFVVFAFLRGIAPCLASMWPQDVCVLLETNSLEWSRRLVADPLC